MPNATLSVDSPVAPFELNSTGWASIIEKTSNFTLPEVQYNVLGNGDKVNFKKWIFDVIRYICLNKTDVYGFRVYVEGEIVNSDYLNTHVYPHIPLPDDDGSAWIKEVFQQQKFGIILNDSEKFSLQIAERLSAITQPLLENLGVPSNGMHTTVFIGNYGFTPLGIHQDHFGANVIHFHLGPGDKTMYTWEAGLFEAADGKNRKLEELLPIATAHHFREGDLFFMPWDQYHIGKTDEISIGLTVWFDNHSNQALFERLLKSIAAEFNHPELQEITHMQNGICNIDLAPLDTIFRNNENAVTLSFKELLKEAFLDFKLALFSNCGWTSLPVSMSQVSDFKVGEDFNTMDHTALRVPYPFKLYHTVNNENITIYARGSKIMMKYHPLLLAIIERLNTNEVISTDSLLSELNTAWPPQAGLYFLAMLYDKRAVALVN